MSLLYDRALHHLVATHGHSPEEARALMESRPVLVRVLHKRHATAREMAKILNDADRFSFSEYLARKREKHGP